VDFSSNRFPSHVLLDGRPIPGVFADLEELVTTGGAILEVGIRLEICVECLGLEEKAVMGILARPLAPFGAVLRIALERDRRKPQVHFVDARAGPSFPPSQKGAFSCPF